MSDRWPGTSWRIVSVGEQPITGEATIGFDDENRVFGRSVVNRFFGTYRVEGDSVVLGPLGSTMMAGSAEAMAEEQLVLRAFDGPMAVVDQADGSVVLQGGSTAVRLEPIDLETASGTTLV